MKFKFINEETSGGAVVGTDITRIERFVGSVWTPLRVTWAAVLAYVQANLTFPSTTLSGSAVTHTIGTAFQPSTTKVVNGSYAVAVNVQSLLLGTAEERVDLLIGPTSTPTLVADTVTVKVSGVLNLNNTQTMTLKTKIPAGWYAKLVATTVSGTGTATWVSGYEQTEG